MKRLILHLTILSTLAGSPPLLSQGPRDLCSDPAEPLRMPFTDIGTTCGKANSQEVYGGTCGLGATRYPGPDAIYEIVLFEDNEVSFRLDPRGSEGDLMLVLVRDCGDGETCVVNSPDFSDPNRPEVIPTARYEPGTYSLYVDSSFPVGSPGSCGDYILRVEGSNPPPASADLAVEVSSSPNPLLPRRNRQLTYTLTAINNEDDRAVQEVVILSRLPEEVTFLSASAGCAESEPGLVGCRIETLAAGARRERTLRVSVPRSFIGTLVNRVSISAPGIPDPDESDNTAEEETPVSPADLALTLAASDSSIHAGEGLVYVATVENLGPAAARGVLLRGLLEAPPGVAISATEGCGEDPSAFPECPLGLLPPGSRRAVSYTAEATPSVAEGSVLRYRVTANARNAVEGRRAEVGTEITAGADLVLRLAAPRDPVVAGRPLAYSSTLENLGPSDAREVSLRHALVPELTPAAFFGCSEIPGAPLACGIGTLAAGGSVQTVLSVPTGTELADASSITHTASAISATAAAEPGRDRRRAEVLTEVLGGVDLSLEIVDTPDPVFLGGAVEYSIGVLDAAAPEADGLGLRQVKVVTRLPPGIPLVDEDGDAGSTSGCEEDPAGVPICTLDPGLGEIPLKYRITVEPEADGVLITEAEIVASDPLEVRPGDESATEETAVLIPAPMEGPIDFQALHRPREASIDRRRARRRGPEEISGTVAPLVLPFFVAEPGDPAGASTLFAVRNRTKSLSIVRYEYLSAVDGRPLRRPELLPLPGRTTRTVNLLDVPGLVPDPLTGLATGTVAVTPFDAVTGEAILDRPVLSGDFFRFDEGVRSAGGEAFLDAMGPTGRLCRRWDLPLFDDELPDLRTRFVFFVPADPGDVGPAIMGRVYGRGGFEGRPLEITPPGHAFEIDSDALPLEDNARSVEWEIPGTGGNISAIVATGTLSAAIPAFCVDPEQEPGESLLLPFFEVRPGGDERRAATTLLAVHNGGETVPMEIDIRLEDGTSMTERRFLPAHGTLTLDLGEEIAPATGIGHVVITPLPEGGAPPPPLSGSYLIFETAAGAGGGGGALHGGALVARRPSPSGLCRRWDLRFLNRGPLTTDFLFSAPDHPEGFDTRLYGSFFDEGGRFVTAVEGDRAERTFRLSSEDLDLTAGAGTVEWRFAPGVTGHVAAVYRRGDELSVLIPGDCRDDEDDDGRRSSLD